MYCSTNISYFKEGVFFFLNLFPLLEKWFNFWAWRHLNSCSVICSLYDTNIQVDLRGGSQKSRNKAIFTVRRAVYLTLCHVCNALCEDNQLHNLHLKWNRYIFKSTCSLFHSEVVRTKNEFAKASEFVRSWVSHNKIGTLYYLVIWYVHKCHVNWTFEHKNKVMCADSLHWLCTRLKLSRRQFYIWTVQS